MKIPEEVIAGYVRKTAAQPDVDCVAFMRMFDEPQGCRVVEVGSHDEPVSNVLSSLGYNVTGVDLREYDAEQGERNYEYVRADFCGLPREVRAKWAGEIDCIVMLSCIEHFGLGTYQEGHIHSYYDVIAMRTAYDLLKPGGTLYLSVPFGARFVQVVPHWRIYDVVALDDRLIQDFDRMEIRFYVSGPGVRTTRNYLVGEEIPVNEAVSYVRTLPHISVVAKLKKPESHRLSPDGR